MKSFQSSKDLRIGQQWLDAAEEPKIILKVLDINNQGFTISDEYQSTHPDVRIYQDMDVVWINNVFAGSVLINDKSKSFISLYELLSS